MKFFILQILTIYRLQDNTTPLPSLFGLSSNPVEVLSNKCHIDWPINLFLAQCTIRKRLIGQPTVLLVQRCGVDQDLLASHCMLKFPSGLYPGRQRYVASSWYRVPFLVILAKFSVVGGSPQLISNSQKVKTWLKSTANSSYRLGVERTPDPETSGNRCAKPGPRYPTQLSTKVLISMLTVYYILNVSFSLCKQSLCNELVMRISAQSIAWLRLGIFLKENWKYWGVWTIRILLTGPSPDFSSHTRYPTGHRFSLFVPPVPAQHTCTLANLAMNYFKSMFKAGRILRRFLNGSVQSKLYYRCSCVIHHRDK